MTLKIKKAVREARRMRFALIGKSKSGKTCSALKIMRALVGEDGKIGVVSSEGDNCEIYCGAPGIGDFDIIELESFGPTDYIAAWNLFQKNGYDGIITDSLSHAWIGKGGCLDIVDQSSSGSNKFTGGWSKATPLHNELITAINQLKTHHIATMRQKVEYILEDGPGGKKTPKQVGMAAVQREGMEYEFDLTATMNDADMIIDGVRGLELESILGKTFRKPGVDFVAKVRELLASNLDTASVKPEPPAPAEKSAAYNAAKDALGKCKTVHEVKEHEKKVSASVRLSDTEKLELLTLCSGCIEAMT